MAEENRQELKSSEFIANLFNLSERRVQQLTKEGILPAAKSRPYKFDLKQTVQAYIKYLNDKANGKDAKTVDVTKAEADKVRAEADLKQSKAKIAAMQLKELEGEMHRSEDVEAMTNDLVYTIRSMVMALPGRLAMDIVRVSSANEASALIRSECNKVLEELSGYQYDPEAYQRRVREREGWSVVPEDEGDD